MFLDTIVWSAMTTSEPIITGSMPPSGMDACVPHPVIVAQTQSEAVEKAGTVQTRICPIGSFMT